jgi:hypothetical protein
VSTAVLVLVACAALDLGAAGAVLAVAWITHRRMRREAAANGEVLPSAAGQFGCLAAAGLVGFVVLCGIAWLVIS